MTALRETVRVPVSSEVHVAQSVRQARRMAVSLGFGSVPAHYIATAAAELANNLLIHAGGGEFLVSASTRPPGLVLETRDQGPGIADIGLALTDGFSTAGGLGCGLPGVKRLMDTLEIHSPHCGGTHIKAEKWL